jgi:Ca-activated chloride channel family protein
MQPVRCASIAGVQNRAAPPPGIISWVASLSVLLIAPFVPDWAIAQAPPDAADTRILDQGLVEREEVRLILLAALVTNSKGRPIMGLGPEDLRIFESEMPRPIEFVATVEELPIALAFVLDVSGSMEMRGRLDDAKQVVRSFIAELRPGDRAGLICFADDQVTWVTEFTDDRERFLTRLSVQEGRGPTALYDALAASPGLVDSRTRERKAIVLLTDGLDNASQLSQLEAVWIARRVHVPIYTVNFIQQKESRLPKAARQNLRVLERFSSETGGAGFAVHNPRELRDAVSRIQAELTFQYLIGYYPSAGERDGEFRRIRVETFRRGLKVRTRSGYYAEP